MQRNRKWSDGSTSAPPSRVQTSSIATMKEGSKVFLTRLRTVVGIAVLLPPVRPEDKGNFRRKLHGWNLGDLERKGEHLLPIHTVPILESFKTHQYSYNYRGQEKRPKLLSDMSGIHCWDGQERKPHIEMPSSAVMPRRELRTHSDIRQSASKSGEAVDTQCREDEGHGNEVRTDLQWSKTDNRQNTSDPSHPSNQEFSPADRTPEIPNEIRSMTGEHGMHTLPYPCLADDEVLTIPPLRRSARFRPAEASTRGALVNFAVREGDNLSYSEESNRDSGRDYQLPLREGNGKDTSRKSKKADAASTRNSSLIGKKRKRYESTRRTKRISAESNLSKKRKAAVGMLESPGLLNTKCCTQKRCFANTDVVFPRNEASWVLLVGKLERRSYLKALLDRSSNMFFFACRPVCYRFLEVAFGFSRDIQRSVKGTPEAPKLAKEGGVGRDSATAARDPVICFLEQLAESTADMMPDKDEKHLPYFQKTAVYEIFASEYEVLHEGSSPPVRSYFFQIWNKHCNSIKEQKVQRFTKCTECEQIRDALAKAGTDDFVIQDLRKRRTFHLEMVSAERREYQKKCEMAALYPSKCTSIVIDGADQSGFGLPHFTVNTKATTGRELKTKLIGVLEHGTRKNLSLYMMTTEFETGANHVIEALHRTLIRKHGRSKLQVVLYLQLDNCTRENKNAFMFAYLECLVAWGVFTEVYSSFLPRGYTHDDMDKTFSCTSRRLRVHRVYFATITPSQ